MDQPSTVESTPSEPSSKKTTERFEFTGKAGEFFGIWFVNHTLTWMTLGIYSAWAKVRTFQYFYSNTSLAGGHFYFTAKPTTILRSRIIAALLFVLYFASEALDSTVANTVFICMIVAFFLFIPVLTILMVSFRARYSEWRGIKFRFNKNYKEGYFVYILPSALIGLFLLSFWLPTNSEKVEEFLGLEQYEWSQDVEMEEGEGSLKQEEGFNQAEGVEPDSTPDYGSEWEENPYLSDDAAMQDGADEEAEGEYINPYLFVPAGVIAFIYVLALPYFSFISQRFYCRNLRLGTAQFSYSGDVKQYYQAYALWMVFFIGLAALWGVKFVTGLNLWLILIPLSALFIPFTQAYFKSIQYNLLMGNAKLADKHQLVATTHYLSLFGVLITNSLAIAFTFGFMNAWAKVRTARYFISRTSVIVDGNLDDFCATQQEEASALAEEMADMFDVDII